MQNLQSKTFSHIGFIRQPTKNFQSFDLRDYYKIHTNVVFDTKIG